MSVFCRVDKLSELHSANSGLPPSDSELATLLHSIAREFEVRNYCVKSITYLIWIYFMISCTIYLHWNLAPLPCT